MKTINLNDEAAVLARLAGGRTNDDITHAKDFLAALGERLRNAEGRDALAVVAAIAERAGTSRPRSKRRAVE